MCIYRLVAGLCTYLRSHKKQQSIRFPLHSEICSITVRANIWRPTSNNREESLDQIRNGEIISEGVLKLN